MNELLDYLVQAYDSSCENMDKLVYGALAACVRMQADSLTFALTGTEVSRDGVKLWNDMDGLPKRDPGANPERHARAIYQRRRLNAAMQRIAQEDLIIRRLARLVVATEDTLQYQIVIDEAEELYAHAS